VTTSRQKSAAPITIAIENLNPDDVSWTTDRQGDLAVCNRVACQALDVTAVLAGDSRIEKV
jgi:PAS domain-containing protein